MSDAPLDAPPADAPPADAPPADAPPADAPPAAPEWLTGLPDDLKGDATLSRYKSIEDLARGHIEAHKVAKSKLSIPGEGASAEDWGKVWDALGRPADPNAYDIPTIELPVDATDEQRQQLAQSVEPFKKFAHELGLTPAQAKALGQFDLDRTKEFYAKGDEDVAALKTQLGKDFDPKMAAAQQIAKQIFGADLTEFSIELDRKVGSAALLKGMMRLAEIASEHKIVDSDTVEGFGDVKDANAKIDELQANKEWRERYKAGDAKTVGEYNRLLDLAKRQAMRGATA